MGLKGKLIVIYGINNIGKTVQSKKLISYLKFKKFKVHYFKIPVYNLSPTGPLIDRILRRGKKQEISEEEFQRMYAKNRKDYQPIIKKKLEKGYIVVAEDYVGTGLAWGSVKGASMDYLKKINKGIIKENLAILLDGERFTKAKEKKHIHENCSNKIIGKVRSQHIKLAREYDWKIVNANQDKEKVFEDIRKKVDKLIF
jgi:dTMP kinase